MAHVINTNVLSLNAQRNLRPSQDSRRPRCSGCRRACASTAPRTTLPVSRSQPVHDPDQRSEPGRRATPTTASRSPRRPKAPLDELDNNLQRIRELAVQSANATNSASTAPPSTRKSSSASRKSTASRRRPRSTARRCSTAASAPRRSRSARTSARRSRVNLTTGVRADQLGQIATATGTAVTSARAVGARPAWTHERSRNVPQHPTSAPARRVRGFRRNSSGPHAGRTAA